MKPSIEFIPGTIGYELKQHQAELYSASTPAEMKRKAVEIVKNGDIKSEKDRQDFILRMNKQNPSNMLSTLAAYMTGMTVSK